MALKQGEIKISGQWKGWDRRKARQAMYRVVGASGEIEAVGERVVAEAKSIAAFSSQSKDVERSGLAYLPELIRFKDIKPFGAKRNTLVSKAGDKLLVGLVISDHRLSMALEFGAETRNGYLSPTGFMRVAALKVAKSGLKFQPAKKADQDKQVARAQKSADRTAKRVSQRNRKNARKGRRKRR